MLKKSYSDSTHSFTLFYQKEFMIFKVGNFKKIDNEFQKYSPIDKVYKNVYFFVSM
jgi:hypothetical protein